MEERDRQESEPESQPWVEPPQREQPWAPTGHVDWAPTPLRPPWWRNRTVQAVGVVVAVCVVAAAAFLAGHASSGTAAASATDSPSPSAAQVDVAGTLTIPFAGTDLFAPNARDPEPGATAGPGLGDPCITQGGFTDISQGAAVTVGGANGQTLAIGALSAGSVIGKAGQAASCQFSFSVWVAAGQSEYTVTISHRGTQVFTPAQVAAGIQLGLGGQ